MENKFNIGDRIKVIYPISGDPSSVPFVSMINRSGIIIQLPIDKYPIYQVKFNDKCDEYGRKIDDSYYLYDNELELDKQYYRDIRIDKILDMDNKSKLKRFILMGTGIILFGIGMATPGLWPFQLPFCFIGGFLIGIS